MWSTTKSLCQLQGENTRRVGRVIANPSQTRLLFGFQSTIKQSSAPNRQKVPRERGVRTVVNTMEEGGSHAVVSADDDRRTSVVERIHSTQTKLVLFVTGGGMHTSTWLLSVPGASRTVLDVRIPYSQDSMEEVLPPEIHDTNTGSASVPTAIALAKAAYRKAVGWSAFGTPVMGVGVTCGLATDRHRRGDDKIFISVYGPRAYTWYSLILEKGARSRLEEDVIASELALEAIASAMGVTEKGMEHFTRECIDTNVDTLQYERHDLIPGMNDSSDACVSAAVKKILTGEAKTVEFSGGCIYLDAPRPNRIYLPGSFNPLHDGHRELLMAAENRRPGKEGAFELSIGNADKGLLDQSEIERRVKQFVATGAPVILTQAPLFTMKAELFPSSTFVVGYDTAVRLVQERYYGSETAMMLQFAKLAHQKCDFIVAGRVDKVTGRFHTLEDIEIPEVLRRGSLFSALSADEFRLDISSTELRERSSYN